MFYAVVETSPHVRVCAMFTTPVDAAEYVKKERNASSPSQYKIFKGMPNSRDAWVDVGSSGISTDSVVSVKDKEHWNHLLETTRTLVVDFTASWCGPCQKIKPFFKHLAAQYSSITKVAFVSVDVDSCSEIAMQCEVRQMPTFQVWHNGACVKSLTMVGANSAGLQRLAVAANKL